MTPNLDANQARIEAGHAYTELRAHANSQAYIAAVKWIDALIVQTQCQMTDCGPDKLAANQIRIKQLRAQRSALVDPGGATTGFVFD